MVSPCIHSMTMCFRVPATMAESSFTTWESRSATIHYAWQNTKHRFTLSCLILKNQGLWPLLMPRKAWACGTYENLWGIINYFSKINAETLSLSCLVEILWIFVHYESVQFCGTVVRDTRKAAWTSVLTWRVRGSWHFVDAYRPFSLTLNPQTFCAILIIQDTTTVARWSHAVLLVTMTTIFFQVFYNIRYSIRFIETSIYWIDF